MNDQPTGLATARIAISHNYNRLSNQFPNIRGMMEAFHKGARAMIPCVDICLHDDNSRPIPSFLSYRKPDGRMGRVKVRVLPTFRNVQPQAGRGEMVFNSNISGMPGTLGCTLTGTDAGIFYALTCNHVLTGKTFIDPGNIGEETQENLAGTIVDLGPWVAGKMDTSVDAAIIRISNGAAGSNGLLSADPCVLQDSDCGVTQVEMTGAFSRTQTGFVIHINQSMDVDYLNQQVTIGGLITLSADTNPGNFSPITVEGDSGALVYHASLRQPIGIVLGANDQFTFAMPIQTVLGAFPELSLTILE
jgi:hypothetical protein